MDDLRFVLAADPGKTTGWALWDLARLEFSSGQEPWLDFARRTHDWVARFGAETQLVSERFIINQGTVKNSQAPWSLRCEGVLHYLAHTYTSHTLDLQSPSDAKSMMIDARLKAHGWHARGKVHANDAARHLGLWLITRRLLVPETDI